MCVCMSQHMWKSEDNLVELVLSFFMWVQVARVTQKMSLPAEPSLAPPKLTFYRNISGPASVVPRCKPHIEYKMASVKTSSQRKMTMFI